MDYSENFNDHFHNFKDMILNDVLQSWHVMDAIKKKDVEKLKRVLPCKTFNYEFMEESVRHHSRDCLKYLKSIGYTFNEECYWIFWRGYFEYSEEPYIEHFITLDLMLKLGYLDDVYTTQIEHAELIMQTLNSFLHDSSHIDFQDQHRNLQLIKRMKQLLVYQYGLIDKMNDCSCDQCVKYLIGIGFSTFYYFI